MSLIDLAPGHKQGLTVANPVLLAGGSVGCGEAVHPELDLRALGAVVVGPLSLHARAGSPMPRSGGFAGGLVLETGTQNRGLDATLRRYRVLWGRLGVPVVVQVAESDPRSLRTLLDRLAECEGVAGVELLLPLEVDATVTARAVEACVHHGELPVWVKLPLTGVEGTARVAAAAGAHALVVAQSPLGAAAGEGGEVVTGRLHGPALFPLVLHALRVVADCRLSLPLIAAGGIHTLAQARAALDNGASALQLDAVAWVEPALPERLAAALMATPSEAGSR